MHPNNLSGPAAATAAKSLMRLAIPGPLFFLTFMAQYVEISSDGTRTVVKYNPHHDGPVSERLTLVKKLNYLKHYCQEHPAHWHAKEKLKQTQWKLSKLDRYFSKSRRPEVTTDVL